MDTKGRARRLPIKADIRKALCFPGGSTLMVCHLRTELIADPADTTKCLPLPPHKNLLTSANAENDQLKFTGQSHIDLNLSNKSTYRTDDTENGHLEALVEDGISREFDDLSCRFSLDISQSIVCLSVSHISICCFFF